MQNFDAQTFKTNTAKLFSSATGCTQEQATDILFENQNFDQFDEVSGEGKLELVRAQIRFFATTRAQINEESDAETKEMLDILGQEQLEQAQKTIVSHIFASYEQLNISKTELKKRCKAVLPHAKESIQNSIKQAAESILDEPLFEENYE